MPSNHLVLCRPLLPPPSVFPSIRVFSNELALLIRWPKYWSFGFNISPSNEYSGLISFKIDWHHLLAVQGTAKNFDLKRCYNVRKKCHGIGAGGFHSEMFLLSAGGAKGDKMVLRRKYVYLKSRSESRASQPGVCNPRLEYSDWPSADLDLRLSLET